MFDQFFNENSARSRRPVAMALSFAGQVLIVGLAVLFPVLRPEGIGPVRLWRVVTAPAGMRTASRPVKQTTAVHTGSSKAGPHVFVEPVLRQPRRVPTYILTEYAEPPAQVFAGTGGPAIPGAGEGVPWATGTDMGQAPKLAPPKPLMPPARVAPIRVKVGGMVQAAKIMRQATPLYPPLARQARISGTVRLEAVIGRDGVITSLRLVSGHPLLAPAALDAVRQWVYQPTLLNGEPVEVLTQIEVNFKLGE